MKRVALFCGCAAVMLIACGGESSSNPVNVANDAGTTPRDDGGAASTAVRKLITVPLFAGGDVENRVSDPLIELHQWFFTDPQTGASTVHVNRVAFGQSPAGQAAVFIPGASQNARGVTFGVTFKLPSVAYTAGLWVGAKSKNVTGVFPAVITSDDDGTGMPGYFELVPDPARSDVVASGLHWTRFTVDADAPKVAGWGYLYGATDGSQDLYVGGFDVVTGTGKSHMAPVVGAGRAVPESALRFVAHAKAHHPAPPRPQAR